MFKGQDSRLPAGCKDSDLPGYEEISEYEVRELAEARVNDAVLELMQELNTTRQQAEEAVKEAAEKL